MIISASTDYRAAAERKLPPFLFHYIDGGAYAEQTLKRNVEDFRGIALRQRVLRDMGELSLETRLFDETLRLPIVLAPVGLTGMYARRGEVQAARAAAPPRLWLQSTTASPPSFVTLVTRRVRPSAGKGRMMRSPTAMTFSTCFSDRLAFWATMSATIEAACPERLSDMKA